MSVKHARRPSFDDPELQHRIMRLRRVDNVTNLLYLGREYACLAGVIGGAICFAEMRGSMELAWVWNIPVFLLAISLIGAMQHRLAGLGHESSHYTFMKHRFLNDLIPDIFCMFPLFTTVHFYRVFHMAHHQFTNDPERDADLLNLGRGKRAFEFPMSRGRFVAVVYFCMIVAPLRFLEYQWAYVAVNSLGKGRSIYTGTATEHSWSRVHLPRLGTALGIAFVGGYNVLLWFLTMRGSVDWLPLAALVALGVAMLGPFLLPDRAIFHSPFRQAYSPRFGASARLVYFTLLWTALAWLRVATSGHSTTYFLLLWCLPIASTFPFFMLLRDVYQHSNADGGRLTNSRVFFTDPFTRWAVMIYGQDMHVPHHLFPAIPHYNLGELHELLKDCHEEYHDKVIECHGTFHGTSGRPTILDEMTCVRHTTRPTIERE